MIDVNKLGELVAGDTELLASLVDLFKADAPDLIVQVEQGLAKEDVDSVQYAAHRLKGQLRNFFEDQVSVKLAAIEAYGKSTARNQAQDLLSEVKAELPKVIEELDALVKKGSF